MNNLISEDYLVHHGVKGMRWGVRHDKPSTSSTKAKTVGKVAKTIGIYAFPPTRYKALYNKHKELKQKKFDSSDYAAAKRMSDQELRERINRINLEQTYLNAMERDRASAKKASETVIERYGNQTLNDKNFRRRVITNAAKTVL